MKSVKENFIYNLAYQVLTFLTPLITTPYLSRILGAEKLGIYSYSYSIAYYFVLFAMLGLNNYGNREIAKVRDDKQLCSKTFCSIYGLQVCTSIVAMLAYCSYLLFFNCKLISWFMLMYVISTMFDINWFFWGLEEFKITIIRNTIIKLLTVIGILLLVKSQDDIYIYTALMVGGMLLSAIALWPYLKTRVKFYRPGLKDVLSHLVPNMVLFIPVIAVSLYKVMDKIMLGNMASYEEVGFYDYSERVIAIPICVVNALGTVMLPRMSNLVYKKEDMIEKDTIYKSLLLGVAMACAMSFGLMSIANIFVPFFYGSGYEKCITIFYILLPSCIFLAIANVIRTQYLIPHSMDKQYIISLLLGAVVNLCVNALLIPYMQSIGAAIGTLLAEGCVCAAQFICVKKYLPIKKYFIDIFYLIFSAFIMFFIVLNIPVIGGVSVSLIIKIFIGMLVFGVLIMLKYHAILHIDVKRNK